jgi:type IV secretory pathway TrbD component
MSPPSVSNAMYVRTRRILSGGPPRTGLIVNTTVARVSNAPLKFASWWYEAFGVGSLSLCVGLVVRIDNLDPTTERRTTVQILVLAMGHRWRNERSSRRHGLLPVLLEVFDSLPDIKRSSCITNPDVK